MDVAPLVSVVIPCGNQGRFLADAIDSALRQTHSPIDVVVVDDGSIDDTAVVARAYASIEYVHQQNSGTAVARNAGLRESRGEFVVFLDADDRLLPDAVSIGLAYLRDHPDCAFVTGHVRLIGPNGEPEGVPPQDHADGDQYIALLRSNYIWTPGAVLYRRSILEAAGAFDPLARASADFELNIRIARQFPIACHHQVVLEYRRHGANMSADARRMLESAVTVRRAQRVHAATNPSARRAWRDGIAIVKADFGGRLLDQVGADLRMRGGRRRALGGLLCLIRYYPAGFVKRLAARARSAWAACWSA